MVQGGSAVQFFNGPDARQFKVSVNSKSGGSDFGAVLSQKKNVPAREESNRNHVEDREKLNKQELTRSTKAEDKPGAAHDRASEKNAVRKETGQTEGSTAKVQKNGAASVEKSKSLASEVKALLKKLGMTDEDADAVMELLPAELIESMASIIASQMAGVTVEGEAALSDNLQTSMNELGEIMGQLNAWIDNAKGGDQELTELLPPLQEKLEMALANLKNMDPEVFSGLMNEVLAEEPENSQSDSLIEVKEILVTENAAEISDRTTDASEGVAVALEDTPGEADTTEEQDGSGESQLSGRENARMPVENSQTQVETSFQETLKVENNLIKNVQPMELASARVRLTQDIMSQVLHGAKNNLNPVENGQQVILRLRPEELGNVDLKLSVEKGILMAEFNVESQVVKEALESNMSDLKQALSEKGYSVEGMQVSVGQDQKGQQENLESRFFRQNAKRKYFFLEDETSMDFESLNKSLAGLQSTFEYLG